MSEKIEGIIESLKSLTLLEASELVSQIEEVFGVDASSGGGMMMMAGGAAAPAADGSDSAVADKSEFDLALDSVPADKKIAVLKIVRTLTGLGLKEAKDLVESAPKVVKEAMAKEEAEEAKTKLEEAGAVVSLK